MSSSHQTISHDKRKNGETSTIAIKDRRSSHGKSTAPLPHHSHPDGIDGEITRSELNSEFSYRSSRSLADSYLRALLTGASPEDDEDGKRGGKKTSEKRKAQNRQAQRNFRERKEKHLKDLEDKVGALEQRANDTESENSALKQLLQQ